MSHLSVMDPVFAIEGLVGGTFFGGWWVLTGDGRALISTSISSQSIISSLQRKEKKNQSLLRIDHFILRQVLSPPHHWIKMKQSQRQHQTVDSSHHCNLLVHGSKITLGKQNKEIFHVRWLELIQQKLFVTIKVLKLYLSDSVAEAETKPMPSANCRITFLLTKLSEGILSHIDPIWSLLHVFVVKGRVYGPPMIQNDRFQMILH